MCRVLFLFASPDVWKLVVPKASIVTLTCLPDITFTMSTSKTQKKLFFISFYVPLKLVCIHESVISGHLSPARRNDELCGCVMSWSLFNSLGEIVSVFIVFEQGLFTFESRHSVAALKVRKTMSKILKPIESYASSHKLLSNAASAPP